MRLGFPVRLWLVSLILGGAIWAFADATETPLPSSEVPGTSPAGRVPDGTNHPERHSSPSQPTPLIRGWNLPTPEPLAPRANPKSPPSLPGAGAKTSCRVVRVSLARSLPVVSLAFGSGGASDSFATGAQKPLPSASAPSAVRRRDGRNRTRARIVVFSSAPHSVAWRRRHPQESAERRRESNTDRTASRVRRGIPLPDLSDRGR
jgi:hypothetical protein